LLHIVRPLISATHGDSSFIFNFDGPWFPPPPGSNATDGLVVRVQEDCMPECTGWTMVS
jgi:hypothetical protein